MKNVFFDFDYFDFDFDFDLTLTLGRQLYKNRIKPQEFWFCTCLTRSLFRTGIGIGVGSAVTGGAAVGALVLGIASAVL